MSAALIVFSGLDGAGKSTQIELLRDSFRSKGIEPIYIWSRGGYTPVFEFLKSLMRKLTGKKLLPPSGRTIQRERSFKSKPLRWLWLHIALLDLLILYGIRLRWWLLCGKKILCDRYIWDTLIDFRLNFPHEKVENWLLWQFFVWISPQPDQAFLFLIPVEESLRRSAQKEEPFPDSAEVLEKRLAEYRQLENAGHWKVLDGLHSKTDLAGFIQSQVLA